MYDVKYIPLKKLFSSKRGNGKYTRTYCNNNKGEYEVYTGTTIGSFGAIKTYDFDEINLSYTTDGEYAGTVSILTGKYNIGGHRALLTPLVENLYIEYFEIILPTIFYSQKRSNCVPTLTWKQIEDLLIPVPVDNESEYSYDAQIEIANKLRSLSNKKKVLLDDKERLIKASIEIDLSKYEYEKIQVNEIFDLTKSSNSSKFTKGFIQNNLGNIPVYGATKIDGEAGYGYVCDNAEIVEVKMGKKFVTKVRYFEDCLTYNIDGSAGFIFYRKGRFSLSEKVRPLILKEKYKSIIDQEYLKYILQPIFRENVRGRRGPNGENEFTKISKTIIQDLFVPIPINGYGEIDIDVQKEIANKYKDIENIKKAICREIDNLLAINLDI